MATNRRQREARDSRQADARAWASQPDQFESKVLKLPEGVEQYKLEVGRHEVDFMPWLVGKNNPRADEGFAYYMREYRAHEIPTPDGKKPRYCCRYDCFKKKCPACEFMNSGAGGDAELAKALKAKFRMLWLVNDAPGAKKVKWKVLEIFQFNMGKGFGELMKDAINSLPEGEQPFALEGGYSAILTVKEIAMPTSKYNGVTRIDFKKRGYDYPESLLEKAPCLDDCLIDAGYDTLKELLQGGATEEDDDEVPTKRGRDEDDDSDDTEEDDEPTPPRSQKGKKPIPEDDEDDTDSDEDEGSDDTDEDGEPVAAKGKKGTKKAEPTADEFGLKKGMRVKYKGEEYDIIKISGDGTSLTLEDDDGEEKRAVSPAEVKTLVKAKTKAVDPVDDGDDDEDEDRPTRGKSTAAGKKGSSKDSTDDEDEEGSSDDGTDDSDEDDDEPTTVKKTAKKPTRASDDEDDEDDSFEEPDEDDEDSSEDDEDSDDEDEPAPVKKGGKKTTTKRR